MGGEKHKTILIFCLQKSLLWPTRGGCLEEFQNVVIWLGTFGYFRKLATEESEALLGAGLYVPRLNFKPFHITISEGLHVAVGISSKSYHV